MTGKHSRKSRWTSPTGIAASAAVATILAAGGAFGAVQLTSQSTEADPVPAATSAWPTFDPTSASPSTSPSATPTATPTAVATSPKATTSPQHASRSTRRPTPRPTATASTKAATSKVISSGTCGASYYDEPQATANGETFDPEALTAAHKTLPFNTRVRVTNPDNGKSVTVRINDRGPYVDGRCLDLSRAAFRAIAPLDLGELTVKYEVLG